MKRFMMLVGVAVVAAAMYVAASPASQQAGRPSAKQFAALKKQVASLSKTLKPVKAEANDADGFVRTCLISTDSVVADQPVRRPRRDVRLPVLRRLEQHRHDRARPRHVDAVRRASIHLRQPGSAASADAWAAPPGGTLSLQGARTTERQTSGGRP